MFNSKSHKSFSNSNVFAIDIRSTRFQNMLELLEISIFQEADSMLLQLEMKRVQVFQILSQNRSYVQSKTW